ncbi:MAG: hypothetical protein HKN48_08595 [Flavobacteriaceae bacterium]|nr:hypothetical protein [Flavobacteriaceae bacterium]
MPTLVPTVHERIAKCGTQVYIDGLTVGADVEVDVGGAITGFNATHTSKNFTVASLVDGQAVRARQDAGSGFTPWSPAVEVENAQVPPQVGPDLPVEVGNCSQCVKVWGCVPGSKIEVLQAGNVVGSATADRHGQRCVPVDLRHQDEILYARMIVCGEESPLSSTPIVNYDNIPKPEVGSPLYGCQTIVPVSEILKGTRIRLESDTTGSLGSFCSCWNSANVRVGAPLVVGHKIRAQGYWDQNDCLQDGPWSEWRDVITPDEGITPVLLEALIENDQVIRVQNQILGAEINVYIAASDDPADMAAATIFGPRPASDEQEIALNEPLVAGQIVWVDQTLCGVTYASNEVEVLPLPPEIHPPTVLAPIYECSGKVTVTNLHAGALVRVYQDGFPIAVGWAGTSNTLTMNVAPGFYVGGAITAFQWVGGQQSDVSNTVIVESLEELHTPRILSPVTLNDNCVWVSGVSPGATVAIYMGGMIIGEVQSSESIVKVPTNNITGPVSVKVSLCDQRIIEGHEVIPIKSPCEGGSWEKTGHRTVNYNDFTISNWDDGCCFAGTSDPLEVPIFGELYYPTINPGCSSSSSNSEEIHPDARELPLVIIAHGYWPNPLDSELGYGYLGHHLASWGMIVFSINLETINQQLGAHGPMSYQNARGEVILHCISEVLADSSINSHLNPEVIGLVGHSMGGEAVVVAQHQNLDSGGNFGIQGVVSIAPTQYKFDIDMREADYFQLSGSKDLLLNSSESLVLVPDDEACFNGMRIFDRAERHKSHAFIYGAVHDPFNTQWSEPNDENDHPVKGWQHRLIAKCLINAFFQNTLLFQNEYEGYLEGLILPPSIRNIEIFQQHLKTNRDLMDNFGDADNQFGIPVEPLNKNLNRKSGLNDVNGAGVQEWEDVETLNADRCIHNTKAVLLGWDQPTVSYFLEGNLPMNSITKSLSFRATQFYESGLNTEEREIDLFVAINDGSQTAKVRIGLVGTVPYYDTEAGSLFSIFRSVRIPSDAFTAVNQSVNLANIQEVRFEFSARSNGHLLIDDIEFDN